MPTKKKKTSKPNHKSYQDKRADLADELQECMSDEFSPKKGKKALIRSIIRKKPHLSYRTDGQRIFGELIDNNEIVVACGPAGVGKSMIALYKAVECLYDETTPYETLVIIKPVVEADEKLGFLPGNMDDKLSVYQYSSLHLLGKMLGEDVVDKLLEEGIIKAQALAYMRGINIDNTILVMEEYQNTTPRQSLMLLTRLGEDAKFIISGDLEQSDRFRDPRHCGLASAMNRLQDIKGIGLFKFSVDDVVRNKLVGRIIERYKDVPEEGVTLTDEDIAAAEE